MEEKMKRPGPRSKWRPKVYHRRVSAALTQRGWDLLDHKCKREGISIGDFIETTLRVEAGETVTERTSS